MTARRLLPGAPEVAETRYRLGIWEVAIVVALASVGCDASMAQLSDQGVGRLEVADYDRSVPHDATVPDSVRDTSNADVMPTDAGGRDASATDGAEPTRDLAADGPCPDSASEDGAHEDASSAFQMPEAAGVYSYGRCQPHDSDSLFIGEADLPETLEPGSRTKVWLVFANCGTRVWTAAVPGESGGYKLGSRAPRDNVYWGRGRLPLPGDVSPNQMVRIDFTITAPAVPGEYGFQWQIVNEGVAWVKEASPLHTVSIRTSVPPATLADLWRQTAHFVIDQDPVPVEGPTSGHREAFAVNRLDVGPATVYLYHRCFGQSTAYASICLSISKDGGQSFSQFKGEIIAPDPGHIFSVAPSVIFKDGAWYMVYEESHVSTIYWAESADGIQWTKKGALLQKDPSAWDGGAMATPGLFLDTDGTIYVFYAGFPRGGVNMSIGYAAGSSMTSLIKYAHNPVLSPPASGWNKGQVSMPRVVRQGDQYYMIHEGATVDFTCKAHNRYGWGLARSRDLRIWSALPTNPLGQPPRGCGNDMPSLFVRYDGNVYAYHTSICGRRIVREQLVRK